MNEPGLDLPACLERVRQRDEEAARQLMDYLHPLVIKLVRAHLPRRTSEEDLEQTVFMKVFTKLEQFTGQVPLEHWVSRIAVNTCLNHLAAEKVRPELRWADLTEEQCQFLETQPSPQTHFDPSQALASREIVEKLMEMLHPKDRLLLTLLHIEGRSAREIAQITGWNETLIRGRAFQARRRFKKHFQNLMSAHDHETP